MVCFAGAYYMGEAFSFLIYLSFLMGNLQVLSETISSLVIGWLTLALVWAELDKRPELRLLEFVPIVHTLATMALWKADYHGEILGPSKYLKIKEASNPKNKGFRFDQQFSFSIDLANIGYDEIVVHEYVVYLDGKKRPPVALATPSPVDQRLSLRTQQRYPIDMQPLNISTPGFHTLRIEVLATTAKASKEVWFFISDDFSKLRYTHVDPLKRRLSHFIKSTLAQPMKQPKPSA